MKNFKDLLSEVAQPKSAEEKRFKDQHTIELIKHPVAFDSQFTGEIEGVTRKPRRGDQEGDTSYDKAYAVKNKPFKMPRNIDEEIEELDEAEMQMWSVEIPSQHNVPRDHLVKVKARNTREAIRKAAGKIGMKDMWGSIKIGNVKKLGPVKEESELDEAGAIKTPSNYAAMMAKKRKNAGTSKFGSHPDKKVKKEGISFKGLLDKVVNENTEYVSEDPDEEIPMMMRQLHFIGYAADEILEYLAIDDLDPEEWWQNKLTSAFEKMQSLHSYVEGDKRMMSYDQDSYSNNMMAGYYGEETELEEATFKASNLKLKSGETVKLDMKDAKVLNNMMKTLNDKNRKEMETNLMKDKKGFEEILAFAREAL